jgi:hypothetical protein
LSFSSRGHWGGISSSSSVSPATHSFHQLLQIIIICHPGLVQQTNN